ncbi:MAG: hypothetical protein ACR2ID_03370 [Chthoniobacterales bacterium]
MSESKKEAKNNGTGPVRMLAVELTALRRELRTTVRAYAARLEVDLAETTAAVAALAPAEKLSREQLHNVRELRRVLSNRKLKPEKGRRKDLRKIDALIEELQALTPGGTL